MKQSATGISLMLRHEMHLIMYHYASPYVLDSVHNSLCILCILTLSLRLHPYCSINAIQLLYFPSQAQEEPPKKNQ